MKKVLSLMLFVALCMQPAVFAQETIVPYIPEEELPDAVKILPAPPEDPSMDFDHDILRYMWGKQQRKDSLRLAMAVRDAIWNLDTTLVILGEPFGVKISKTDTPAIYEVLTRGVTTIENIRIKPKAHYFRIRPLPISRSRPSSRRTTNGCPRRVPTLPVTPSGPGPVLC